tara:strand:+ start:1707 stop:1850 length:144 start_codon:yes stop_codon:yes gene_type:complete
MIKNGGYKDMFKTIDNARVGTQIKETKDEKSLRHYQKYLEEWDKYEK